MIKKEIPNFVQKTFYISGPHAMANAFENILLSLGVPKNHIKIDFFPGYV